MSRLRLRNTLRFEVTKGSYYGSTVTTKQQRNQKSIKYWKSSEQRTFKKLLFFSFSEIRTIFENFK